MTAHQLATYRTVQTATADPGRLILLLLDGAIRLVHQAERALERQDVAAFAESEARAHAIVAELRQALNHDVGGALAANLDRLYAFMLRHLALGLARRDGRCLREVAALLGTLREGFRGAVEAGGGGPPRP
jgi:flagellar protein FliS